MHSLSHESVPKIVTGDLNSTPASSVLHMIMGWKFDPIRDQSELKDKKLYDDAVEILKSNKMTLNNYKIIDQDAQDSLDEINMIQGKLLSAYANHDVFDKDEQAPAMINFTQGHPSYSNYTQKWHGLIDWILFSQENLKLISILEIPSKEELCSEEDKPESVDLPNKIYPSDHLRMEAVFELTK